MLWLQARVRRQRLCLSLVVRPSTAMKPIARRTLFVLIGYIIVYCFLSLCGKYDGNADAMERLLGVHCRCFDDRYEWQPAFVLLANYPAVPGRDCASDSNLIGCFFIPLVGIDREYWHPTHLIVTGNEVMDPSRPVAGLVAVAMGLGVGIFIVRRARIARARAAWRVCRYGVVLAFVGIAFPYIAGMAMPQVLWFLPQVLFDLCLPAGALCLLVGMFDAPNAEIEREKNAA